MLEQPSELQVRTADPADAPVLAEMNAQLIADEGSHNAMTHPQLTERMRQWLQGNRSAVFVLNGNETVGYLVYEVRADEYDAAQAEVFIRQFFIAREHRRRGIGKRAFERIVAEFFPRGASLTLDVLHSNPRAHTFWKSLGFSAYCTTYRRRG